MFQLVTPLHSVTCTQDRHVWISVSPLHWRKFLFFLGPLTFGKRCRHCAPPAMQCTLRLYLATGLLCLCNWYWRMLLSLQLRSQSHVVRCVCVWSCLERRCRRWLAVVVPSVKGRGCSEVCWRSPSDSAPRTHLPWRWRCTVAAGGSRRQWPRVRPPAPSRSSETRQRTSRDHTTTSLHYLVKSLATSRLTWVFARVVEEYS